MFDEPVYRFPETWCVPDETTICDRLQTMTEMAHLDGPEHDSIKQFAAMVKASADKISQNSPVHKGAWRERILAMEALRACQSLPYKGGNPVRECFQRADYTLANGGECKALSVLFVAVCDILGLTADVVWITQTGMPLNHVCAIVELESNWFWADASIRGSMLGESSYEALERLDAHHVIGEKPSGRPREASVEHVHGFGPPNPWAGWSKLWYGWPYWWWCRTYPYLCASYQELELNPTGYGFYKFPIER